MLARLTILSGKRSGEVLELAPGEHQIGTGRAAEIQLRDKDVGFKHARLIIEDGAVFLEDLKSKGGTYLNGEKVEERVPLKDQDELRLGTAELRIELAGAPVAAAPVAAAPVAVAPVAPVEDDEASPPPATAAAPPPRVDEAVPDDPDQLKELVRDLRRRLAQKTQEAQALTEALEASAGAASDAGGYAPSVAEDLEARNLELQQIADEKAALVLERDEELAAQRREIAQLEQRVAEARSAAEKQKDSMAGEVLRSHEKLEEWRDEVKTAKDEVARFEEVNSELLLENEELKERLAALQFQVEQQAADRGSLVRERVKELQAEAERLEQSNAELRTLVEAYEEKIDELDERVEELEGENEALEKLIVEVREELARTKTERETMVKTLRQKLKRLEERAEELEGERARAQAAARAPGAAESAVEARS
ncbi:MAG: FHA domain-containing protein [Planctomycetes bacterium]|nr:FHA domain-containing protein [Planctomycetota bacterium]